MAVRAVRFRLLAALAAFAAGATAVIVVALLAHSTLSAGGLSSVDAGAAPAASAASSTASPGAAFPAPPPGALVLAREDGNLAVGLAVARRAGRLELQASVIGQEQPEQGLSVAFRTGNSASVQAGPCGAGCYRAVVDRASTPRTVEITIRRHGASSGVSFPLPASWRPAAELVRRAETTWRGLATLVVHDRLSSGPGSTIDTIWQLVAPHELTYRIRNGPEAVVIGGRRWDKVVGGGWKASAQDPIRQPAPLWEAVSNAYLLGSAVLRGRPVWELGFFDPVIHAWFTLWVDRATARTLELEMVAQAHFMHQVYGPFNRPLRIVPPSEAAP